ncbi:hypothetical protein CONPUDRAFT_84416 [Coniophora puteana RWD-64-598 SS2]|uniref:DUF7330 domain-containing protein n=1 Tax=Coniophora puteana (strain RWD-64-598) TaxID=741705 RepID=A0A5M3MDZ5_CONPW|nr:uncharacterized protein CONPUDRAFT_84416 [Coniophora puteana RWD-64-598 SS2]EIW77267.1 hypothetical protein CONPUDRAFT_84416 [Coniophora puteana RWD-64-598 SS2]
MQRHLEQIARWQARVDCKPQIAPPTTHTKFPSSKPTNFLHLTAERNWIKGHFTINPFLTLPPALLAPLAPDESTEADRRNLRLAARMGHIDAEITLVGPQRDEQRAAAAAGLMKRRTRMDVSCDHGMANLAIRTPTPTHPYTLHITLKNASSTIRIPTTFTGLITITAERSWVKLGASLSAHSAPISQVGATNRWFVGDDIAALCEGDWLGDVIEIDGSHSRVKVKYVDKVPGGETGAAVGATKAKGFWSRFAGKS